jgi:hypothetical protein
VSFHQRRLFSETLYFGVFFSHRCFRYLFDGLTVGFQVPNLLLGLELHVQMLRLCRVQHLVFLCHLIPQGISFVVRSLPGMRQRFYMGYDGLWRRQVDGIWVVGGGVSHGFGRWLWGIAGGHW